jgi:hypothetical protein
LGQILDAIKRRPEAVYLNFGEPGRTDEKATTGIGQFLDAVSHFGHQVWLSTGVYRWEAYVDFIRYGYAFGYNQMPHTTILLQRLQACPDDVCVLCPGPIIEQASLDELGHWSHINSAIAGGTWLDMPLDEPVAKRLAVLLRGNQDICGYLFVQFLLEGHKHGGYDLARRYFDQYFHRTFALNGSPRVRMKMRLLRLAFRFPRLSWRLLQLLGKAKHGVDGFDAAVAKRLTNTRTGRL